jgi:lysine/ornithine N-monooxygenase
MAEECDVAVVGAGPYGLAVAAHLRAHETDIRVFGEPMAAWAEMPRGMLLRSPFHASTISDPDGSLTLTAYEAALGRTLDRPIPVEDFIAYGRWFCDQAVPDLDRRRVTRVDRRSDAFVLTLEDGEELRARRVVVATGLLDAAARMPELAALDGGTVSHTSELRDPASFAGRRVLVVGGGQSATESAALLQEAGATVEVLMRAPAVNWLDRSGRLHRSRLRPLLYPDTDVGPPVLNRIINHPRLFRSFPYDTQCWIAYRSIRPAAAGWLRPRLADVTVTCGRRLETAVPDGDEIVVRLDDGTSRRVDHVMQGTGYRLDVRAHPLLAPGLAARIRARDGYPVLGLGYESSVPGLHFVGALSAVSLGPVMRFVSGTWATGPAVARAIGPAAAHARRPKPVQEVIAGASRTAP